MYRGGAGVLLCLVENSSGHLRATGRALRAITAQGQPRTAEIAPRKPADARMGTEKRRPTMEAARVSTHGGRSV